MENSTALSILEPAIHVPIGIGVVSPETALQVDLTQELAGIRTLNVFDHDDVIVGVIHSFLKTFGGGVNLLARQ